MGRQNMGTLSMRDGSSPVENDRGDVATGAAAEGAGLSAAAAADEELSKTAVESWIKKHLCKFWLAGGCNIRVSQVIQVENFAITQYLVLVSATKKGAHQFILLSSLLLLLPFPLPMSGSSRSREHVQYLTEYINRMKHKRNYLTDPSFFRIFFQWGPASITRCK